MKTEEYILIFFMIALAVLLPFGILKYRNREKFASIVNENDALRRDILKFQKIIIFLSLVILWSPHIFLIFLPWALSQYSDLNAVVAFTLCALIYASIYVEYRYRRWLYQNLKKLE